MAQKAADFGVSSFSEVTRGLQNAAAGMTAVAQANTGLAMRYQAIWREFFQLAQQATQARTVQDLLALGTKEEIAAACWQVLDDCGGKRVLTGSTSEIHPGISVANAMTMYEIFRNYHDPEFAAANRPRA